MGVGEERGEGKAESLIDGARGGHFHVKDVRRANEKALVGIEEFGENHRLHSEVITKYPRNILNLILGDKEC